MATIGPTGVGIPDVGDPDASASQLVIDNLEDYQSHQHRGPAFNEPPKIGGSSWLGDAVMDQNGQGVINQIYSSFSDPAAESIPNRSIYYDDGVGFVFKTEGGTEATLVTSAGSIPTTVGEGFVGLGPPAQAQYTPGLGNFELFEDEGSATYGNLICANVTCQDVTTSGPITAPSVATLEGSIRHGNETLIIGASHMQPDAVWAFAAFNAALAYEPEWGHNAASNDNLIASIPLSAGDRITAVTVRLKLDTATAGALTAQLYKSETATGTATTMSDLSSAAGSTTRQSLSLANITAEDQVAGTRWFVVMQAAANIVIRVYSVEVTYTRA